MNASQNRRRLNALRAEEAGAKGSPTHQPETQYGPERRRQAQINKQRMRAAA